jgi:AcrR family transcriptional regulator
MAVKAIRSADDGERRARNPQGQGSRLRLELIDAADRMLARTGDVEGLSLRAVAREVGIATPSIYLHFPDKTSLVRAVLDGRFAELGEAVRTAVAGEREPLAQLRAGCLAYCRFGTEHPNAYRILFGRVPAAEPDPCGSQPHDTPSRAGSGHSFVHEAGAGNFGGLVEGVAGCMQAGVVPAGDPTRVATTIWTALHGIVSLRASLPRFAWPALEQQVDDALAGLLRLHHKPPCFESESPPDRYTSVES